MLFGDSLVVIRGGGDLASGVAHRLHRSGFPVVVLELAEPLAIRRTVAFASAVHERDIVVDAADPIVGRLADSPARAAAIARGGAVGVLVSEVLPDFGEPVAAVVDARLAKRNIDTTIDQADLVVALGPGFTAGIDCDAVVETIRGHRLGRVMWLGQAAPDTGVPGRVGGMTSQRVVRATSAGSVEWSVAIGDVVDAGTSLGTVGSAQVSAPIAGVVRGLITPGIVATEGLKIADIDPRHDRSACFEISDKARLVGAGVLEAILVHLNHQ